MTKEKIKHFSILFFSLFLTLAVFSQISAASPKPTYDVGLNKADWLYYKTSNDLSAYLGKKSSNLPTVRYQKNKDYLEFSLNNVSSTTSTSLETKEKDQNNPILFYRNILDSVDANYQITNIPFKIKEEIILKQRPTTYNLPPTTFLFSAETTGKPVKQKDGSIAFFGDNGDYLFQLDKPFMVDGKGMKSEEVGIDITSTKTKTADKSAVFGDSNLERKSGLSPVIDKYTDIKTFVNSLYNKYVNNKKVLDLVGIEPPDSQVTNRSPHQVRPRTKLFYHKENLNPVNKYTITITADSNWLSTATYPIIIDPTVTHNSDSNFTGQMNRIADSDTTSSTQLESSYPEQAKDPYTVLLLHFNEANGTTVGITDMASSTRVITANGNASTTSYVTKLGLGNSAAFDGTGDYLSVPDSEDWNFGSGDFSIDFWGQLKANSSAVFYSHFIDNNNRIEFFYEQPTGQIFFTAGNGVDGNKASYKFSWTPTLNQWYHFAAIRNGMNFYIFVNGVSQSLTVTTAIASNVLPDIAASLWFGSNLTYGSVNGNLDSIRILKGRALTPEEIKAAASRRPYAVYTSPVIDATASVTWNTLNWTEGGVNTGNGEQPYSTNSLVAQWDFNDTSGTTLTASSSGSCTTACNGTLTGFSYTASQDQATTTTGWTANNKKWGAGALMFESANTPDYISISDPSSNALDPGTGNFSVEGWIKSSAVGQDTIIQNNTTTGACASNAGYILIVNGNRNLAAYASDGTNCFVNNLTANASSTEIADGRWHQFAFVADRGTKAYVYYDGRLATSTSINNTTAINPVATVYMGASGGTGDSDFILDSLRYYSRALSTSEILSNYQAGNIEIQTRTGATSDPNDGSWEAWKPTTGETQLFSMDSDAANWHSDIMASTTIATSTETTIKAEGTGSLKVRMGMASTTAGTVALWHFEETGTTTGTYLYDSTSNANNATTTTATTRPVDGIFGKARYMSSQSDYLSLSPSTNIPTGSAVRSVDFWAKPIPSAMTSGAGYVFGYGAGASNQGFGVSANSGNWWFQGYSAGDLNSNKSVIEGKWTYVAVTYDGTTLSIYIDGILANSAAKSLNTTASAFFIGQAPWDTTNRFVGAVDELRILNRTLSPDEIAENYRMGANHHLTRQVSATDLSGANKLVFNVAGDRPGTYLEAMLGESDYANYELASSTLALSTNTVLYIKGDEIASSTSIKDSSFSGKTITVNGDAKTSGNGKIGNSVYFDGTGDYLSLADSDDWAFGTGDFSIDTWLKYDSVSGDLGIYGHGASNGFFIYSRSTDSTINVVIDAGATMLFSSTWAPVANNWYHLALTRSGNNWSWYVNGNKIGGVSNSSTVGNYTGTANIGSAPGGGGNYFPGYIDEFRIIKGTALSADQIRQAYEYGLRNHPITIDFGATLQPSDLISSATDYNFSITATTSGASATTTGLYLGDKIIVKENLGGTEYTAQGTVNSINTTTGAITVPSWDTGSTFPSSNGYSPSATVFKWQREYFDLTGAATTTRDAITNLTIRPTNGAEGRTIYLDDFRYNTNYLTASSSSAITSSNNRYLQYRAIFSSTDTFVSPFLSAFNTLYTSLTNMFPSLIGVSGGGFLSF